MTTPQRQAFPTRDPRIPGLWKKLYRSLRLQCSLCKSGSLFRRWFHMVDDCPRCSLHFERIEGHWIGAIGMNTIVSFGILMITVFAGMLATYPDIPTGPLTALSLVVAIAVPTIFFPVSRTLWTAIDLAMRPPEAEEADFDEFKP